MSGIIQYTDCLRDCLIMVDHIVSVEKIDQVGEETSLRVTLINGKSITLYTDMTEFIRLITKANKSWRFKRYECYVDEISSYKLEVKD